MTEQAIQSPITAQKSAINFDYGKIRRDLFIRRVGKVGLFLTPIFSYFFLWAPIIVLVVFSFNNSSTISVWGGFTTHWYTDIFNSTDSQFTSDMLFSLRNTLFVAVISATLSTIIGTMVALGLERGIFQARSW